MSVAPEEPVQQHQPSSELPTHAQTALGKFSPYMRPTVSLDAYFLVVEGASLPWEAIIEGQGTRDVGVTLSWGGCWGQGIENRPEQKGC